MCHVRSLSVTLCQWDSAVWMKNRKVRFRKLSRNAKIFSNTRSRTKNPPWQVDVLTVGLYHIENASATLFQSKFPRMVQRCPFLASIICTFLPRNEKEPIVVIENQYNFLEFQEPFRKDVETRESRKPFRIQRVSNSPIKKLAVIFL